MAKLMARGDSACLIGLVPYSQGLSDYIGVIKACKFPLLWDSQFRNFGMLLPAGPQPAVVC